MNARRTLSPWGREGLFLLFLWVLVAWLIRPAFLWYDLTQYPVMRGPWHAVEAAAAAALVTVLGFGAIMLAVKSVLWLFGGE